MQLTIHSAVVTLCAFDAICTTNRIGIRCSCVHCSPFSDQMINEVMDLLRVSEVVNPEFVFGNERESVVLAEVGELFVDFTSYVCAIYEPNRELSDRSEVAQVGL